MKNAAGIVFKPIFVKHLQIMKAKPRVLRLVLTQKGILHHDYKF